MLQWSEGKTCLKFQKSVQPVQTTFGKLESRKANFRVFLRALVMAEGAPDMPLWKRSKSRQGKHDPRPVALDTRSAMAAMLLMRRSFLCRKRIGSDLKR